MNKIILIGQAVIDYMYIGNPCFLERFDLRQNEKHKLDFKTIEEILSAIKPQYKDIGGCVTNTAIGLHNLGRDCSLVLSVGNDAFGFFFLEQLKKYFRIRPIPSAAEGITGVVLTFLEYNDNQESATCAFNHGCANSIKLTPAIKDEICSQDLLYISFYSFYENDSSCLFDLLKYAKEKGARIISDAGGARGIETEKIKEILHIIHGLFGNKPEIECLETRLNMPISEVSKRLWVVKKDGGHNTELYSDGKLALSIPPQLFINPVNSLGAGDAFAAAFLNAYLAGSDFANAISKGNAYAGKILNKQEFH